MNEHKCVLGSCRQLEAEAHSNLQHNGLTDSSLKDLEAAFPAGHSLVSVMESHNEINVVQQALKRSAKNVPRAQMFHSDCAQMVGNALVDVDDMKIDCMSISGPEFTGQKASVQSTSGAGPGVRMEPIMNGGGQERGLRSGTLAPPLCVGFGKACEIAMEDMESDHKWISYLSDRPYNGITSQVDEVILNGDEEHSAWKT